MGDRSALAREAGAIDQRIEDLRRLRNELSDLEAAAAEFTDDWPSTCVCHVLDVGARQQPSQTLTGG